MHPESYIWYFASHRKGCLNEECQAGKNVEESALFPQLHSSKEFCTLFIVFMKYSLIMKPGLEDMLISEPSQATYVCHS